MPLIETLHGGSESEDEEMPTLLDVRTTEPPAKSVGTKKDDEDDPPPLLNAPKPAVAKTAVKKKKEEAKPAATKKNNDDDDDDDDDPPPLLTTPSNVTAPAKLKKKSSGDSPPALLSTKNTTQKPPTSISPPVLPPPVIPAKSDDTPGFTVTMRTRELRTCLALLTDRNSTANILFKPEGVEFYTSDRDSPEYSSVHFFKPYISMTAVTGTSSLISLGKPSRQLLIKQILAHETLHDVVTLRLSNDKEQPKAFRVDIFNEPVYPEYKWLPSVKAADRKPLMSLRRFEINATHLANVLAHASQFSNSVELHAEGSNLQVFCMVPLGTATSPSWILKFEDRHSPGGRLVVRHMPIVRLLDVIAKGTKFTPNCTIQINEHQTSINVGFEVAHRFTLLFFVKEKKVKQ